jgi:hypothetical protein
MMAAVTLLAQAGGSSLASWNTFIGLLVGYVAIVAGLLIFGRSGDHPTAIGRFLLRAPNALKAVTGIPGWAAATVGTGLYGLLIAGEGFYSDVAWHIALGRDDDLFTAPHTSIFIGLVMILGASVLGVILASLARVDTPIRAGALRIPWSTVPLFLLGGAAVMGFPLDELWHAQYGIDVTMWSPTHMLMILGASFSGIASWLVLAEAGVSPRKSAWGTGVHAVAGWLTLQGLAASQGEFVFGVPQFQQLFHPILVCLAAGFALVAIRLVLGPWFAIGTAGVTFLLMNTGLLGSSDGPVETRHGGIYIVSAIAVEAVARLVGTERRLRFALVSGAVVGTVGLAGEWAWNTRAYQPWRTALLPEAVIYGVIAALGAAVLGAAFASAVKREPSHRLPRWSLIAAGLALLLVIAIPMPRKTGDVRVDLTLDKVGTDRAFVNVTLDPPDAADDAKWFQASNWQGGELILADMEKAGPGRFRSEKPVLITGKGKTLVRLHRGNELMAFPVRLPADPEIGEPEIPAVNRSGPFVGEKTFLMRESESGAAWVSIAIYVLLAAVAIAWITAFAVASQRIRQASPEVRPTRPDDKDYALAS